LENAKKSIFYKIEDKRTKLDASQAAARSCTAFYS